MAIDYAYEAASITEEADFFQPPAIEVPPNPPTAHRAVITSVTGVTLTNEKQSSKIAIELTSRDVPTLSVRYDIWLPKAFVTDGIAQGAKFDPATLPETEGNKQQSSYRIGIANSDKRGTLQTLVFNTDSVARAAGRDPQALGLKAPVDLETYAENLSKMLVGVEAIMLLKERGGDPPFNHQMEVKRVLNADVAETRPKALKNYVLAWEQ